MPLQDTTNRFLSNRVLIRGASVERIVKNRLKQDTNDCFTAAQKGFPYATPWLEAELEDTVAVMGEDFHPYGLERNRAQIDAFAGEAFQLGLTSRRVTTDEYFADYLQGG